MHQFLDDVKYAPEEAKAQSGDIQWKTYKGEFQGFRIRS